MRVRQCETIFHGEGKADLVRKAVIYGGLAAQEWALKVHHLKVHAADPRNSEQPCRTGEGESEAIQLHSGTPSWQRWYLRSRHRPESKRTTADSVTAVTYSDLPGPDTAPGHWKWL
jgi:hypothetical protein